MRKLILLLLVITAAAAGGAYCDVPPADQCLVWYLGNVLPTAPNSAGPGVSFEKKFPTGLGGIDGVVVNDAAAIDGKALYINDNSITDYVYYRSGYGLLDNATGATIVGRVKVTSDTHGAGGEADGNLHITDNGGLDSGLTSDYHWGGPGNDIRECIRGSGVGAAGNSLYHTLRMTAKGNQFGNSVPFSEPFTYPDLKLVGRGANPYIWMGDAGLGEIEVVSNTVLLTGGNRERYAKYYVLCAPDVDGKITFEFDIKGTDTVPVPDYDATKPRTSTTSASITSRAAPLPVGGGGPPTYTGRTLEEPPRFITVPSPAAGTIARPPSVLTRCRIRGSSSASWRPTTTTPNTSPTAAGTSAHS